MMRANTTMTIMSIARMISKRSHGVTESRSHGATESRSHGVTENLYKKMNGQSRLFGNSYYLNRPGNFLAYMGKPSKSLIRNCVRK